MGKRERWRVQERENGREEERERKREREREQERERPADTLYYCPGGKTLVRGWAAQSVLFVVALQ